MANREKLMIKNNKKRYFNTFRDFVLTAFPKEKLKIDPYLSRFYRPISLRISWLFFRTGIKPNHVTFMQIISGILGCFIISLLQTKFAFLFGIILLHFSYVLDCVDGEIARVTRTESLQGLFLDKFAHAVTMPAIYITLGIYYSQYSPDNKSLILLITLLAAFSTFNPVNRLVHSILNQLFYKQEFTQYSIKNYKKFNKYKKDNNKNSLNKFSFQSLKIFLPLWVQKFLLQSFRHVTYLALMTIFFIFEAFGLPSKIVLFFWLCMSFSLIIKEIMMLYFVVSTDLIEERFYDLKKISEISVKEN